MTVRLSRRNLLSSAVACCLAGSCASRARAASKAEEDGVRFCLNLGTLRNYDLDLKTELQVALDAGYRSVEIWFDRLAAYAGNEGNAGFSKTKLAELKKFLDGEGLTVEGAIGFAPWIVDDRDRRASGLEELKRQSEALAALGAKYTAAPAAGANEKIDVATVAERYRAILELCAPYGVRPALELWGVSQTLCKVSDCLAICAETGRDDAALLLDVYHVYRGNNSFASLALIAGAALPIFHMNDYPATPERERLNDGDRVFPGDGAAPWREIIGALRRNGFRGVASFEIFNRGYRDAYSATEQARVGLEKMRALWEEF